MPGRTKIVCVVDDDAAVRHSLKFALEAEGLSVRVFDSAASILEHRNVPACKCLIVDFRMPAMDGLDLTAALRERGWAAPTIMITGRTTKDLYVRAQKVGIRHLLEKPLTDGALIDAVRDAFDSEIPQ